MPISNDSKAFDFRLRYVMMLKDVNINQLARLTQLSPATVCRLCNGETYPQYHSLGQICRVLGCDSNFMLGLSDCLKFRK